jgi:DNA-binding CsgD family transcriptional regulator
MSDTKVWTYSSTEEYPAGTQVVVSATGETGVVMNRGRGYSDIHGDSFVKIRLDRRDSDGYLRYDKRYLGEVTKVSAPDVLDALHAEAIEMNEQYDKEENVAQNEQYDKEENVAQNEARRIAGRSTTGPLNDTQHEIMKRVVQGATYQDIADERGWTRNAVADNIRVAVAKMNVPNSTAAAARYAQYLLVEQILDELGEFRHLTAQDVLETRLGTILP